MSRLAISRRFRKLWTALALVSMLGETTGCVERRMTIRSNPPGAAVYVDDYQIGTTPVAVNYTYYGTRKIRLVKDGYETLTVYQPMPAPWYDIFGADFFSENVWPGKIRDERGYDYQMSAVVMVPNDQLLNRAEQLRNNGRVMQAGAVQPLLPPPVQAAPPVETLPPPQTLPTQQATPMQPYVPPQGTYPQPSTISPPAGTAPNYAAPGGATPSYVPQGSAVYPPAGNAAPTYAPPVNAGPSFSSPGGFGVGGSSPMMPSNAPMPLYPETAPAATPQYVPPATTPTAPPAAAPSGAPPAAAPSNVPPYSVPPGWHPMGQAPAADGAVTR